VKVYLDYERSYPENRGTLLICERCIFDVSFTNYTDMIQALDREVGLPIAANASTPVIQMEADSTINAVLYPKLSDLLILMENLALDDVLGGKKRATDRRSSFGECGV
jgi:hypothetical protein